MFYISIQSICTIQEPSSAWTCQSGINRHFHSSLVNETERQGRSLRIPMSAAYYHYSILIISVLAIWAYSFRAPPSCY
jgi:hypothetical protein